jgi:hypothetical protein
VEQLTYSVLEVSVSVPRLERRQEAEEILAQACCLLWVLSSCVIPAPFLNPWLLSTELRNENDEPETIGLTETTWVSLSVFVGWVFAELTPLASREETIYVS